MPACKWGALTTSVPIPPGYGTGVKTGFESDLVVLDIDGKGKRADGSAIDGASELCKRLGIEHGPGHIVAALGALMLSGAIPPTRTVRTPSGGYHFYFRHPGQHTPNSAGTVAEGVDVRGDGGYVLAPPSEGYTWHYEAEYAPLPQWLADEAIKAGASAGKRVNRGGKTPIVARLPNTLEECCYALRNAAKGTRNDLLSRIAFKAGAQAWPNAAPMIESAILGWDPTYQETHKDTIRRQIEAGGAAKIYVNYELARMVEESELRLGHAPDVYAREGELVSVYRQDGAPLIAPIGQATLKSALSEVARYVGTKVDKKTGERSNATFPVPSDVVAALHERRVWPSVRTLKGLAESPCLRPDGTILTADGYDTQTRLYHVPSVLVDVPEAPTFRDAQDAYGRLAYLFRDFPFEDKIGCAIPIAAILTVLARPAIDGPVPGFVFDASTRGSGKTLLAQVVALIATGREAGSSTYPEGRDAKEEVEKVLGSIAINGQGIVLFDNLSDGTRFGCGPLDRVLTSTVTSFRVLGQSTQKTLAWNAVVMGTGNNLSIAKDTSRRVLVSRLEPEMERPESRSGFALADLKSFVRQNRAGLVRDALTILRGFAVSGSGAPHSIGSYERWSAIVAGAIHWITGDNILGAFPAEKDNCDEPEEEAFRALLLTLPDRFPEGASAKDLLGVLEDLESTPLKEALETLIGTHYPTTKRLAASIRAYKGRYVKGRRLSMRKDKEGVNRWSVEGAPKVPPAVSGPPAAMLRLVK